MFRGAILCSAALLLAGCAGGSSAVPAVTDVPLDGAVRGVDGTYVVYRVPLSGGDVADVVPVTGAAPAGSSALAGAVVVYPDGSTQSADALGSFDAAQSAYAAAHPEALGDADVGVTIRPPAASGLAGVQTGIFVPSRGDEAQSWSGTVSLADGQPTSSAGRATLALGDGCSGKTEQGRAGKSASHVTFTGPILVTSAFRRPVKFLPYFIGCNDPTRNVLDPSVSNRNMSWSWDGVGDVVRWRVDFTRTVPADGHFTSVEALAIGSNAGDRQLVLIDNS